MLAQFYGKQTVLAKKKRGPSPTGKGVQVVVRMQPGPLEALDVWIAKQKEPNLSRPEAVRRLIEIGLGGRSHLPRRTENHSQDEKTGKRAK